MPEYFQTQWPHAKAQSSQRKTSKLCASAPLREPTPSQDLLTGKVRVKVNETEEVAADA
jgi:hypothetical protein